mmetsp:Transcript_54308/g.129054  ORF Transcript_54308/g.129054 Transcript_54308/m.129054 type:complete len:242 (+) Transcript_54308:142-867(+)
MAEQEPRRRQVAPGKAGPRAAPLCLRQLRILAALAVLVLLSGAAALEGAAGGAEEERAPEAASDREPDRTSVAAQAQDCSALKGKQRRKCMEEELARLAPEIEAHADCRSRVEGLLAQVEGLEATVLAAGANPARKALEQTSSAQVSNFRAQSEKLVAELGKFQGMRVENDKLTRRMRERTTRHSDLSKQVEGLKQEIETLGVRASAAQLNAEREIALCEHQKDLLEDAYAEKNIRMPRTS